ncbi:MAG: DUF4390 domain-containing protein [Magnetococcales bacterium]|nr:DUF4390 domain-containing protein [Magnetococcales bacterium]
MRRSSPPLPSPTLAALALTAALLLVACSLPDPPASSTNSALAETSLVRQGEKSYVQAALSLVTLKEISDLLQNGEPLLANYRFRLVLIRPWMPDQTVVEQTLSRRLKLHLITRRFEMVEEAAGQPVFTADAETALRFVGNPRYIPLRAPLPTTGKEGRFLLQTWFRLEQEGVSQIFRTLHRLLTFWRPDHSFRQSEFRPS